MLTVIGAAGAGKSRLATKFVAGIEGEALAVWGRCLPYGDGITFWPVAEAVRQLAGIDVDDPFDIARSELQALLREADGSGVRSRGCRDRTGGRQGRDAGDVLGDPPVPRISLTRESARLDLRRSAVGRARVPRSPRLSPPFLSRCPDPPHLPRSGRPARGASEWAARLPGATTLHLPPLGDVETRHLIDELLQGDDLDAGLRGRISEGGVGIRCSSSRCSRCCATTACSRSPERMALDRRRRSRRHRAADDPRAGGGAAGSADAEERAVVHGAAVIGKVFSWGALLDLVPEELRPKVGPILQGLVRRSSSLPSTRPSAVRMRSPSITS